MTVVIGAPRLTPAAQVAEAAIAERADATTDLDAMTVKQLRELCAERGIEAPSKATKEKLKQLLMT